MREHQTEWGCGDDDSLACAVGEGRVVFGLPVSLTVCV